MKEEKVITESNEIIAKFMGFEDGPADSFSKNNHRLPTEYRMFMNCSHFAYLRFDTSWDWLMPVVEKIFSLNNVFGEEMTSVRVALFPIDIQKLYNVVVEFIKWYNGRN